MSSWSGSGLDLKPSWDLWSKLKHKHKNFDRKLGGSRVSMYLVVVVSSGNNFYPLSSPLFSSPPLSSPPLHSTPHQFLIFLGKQGLHLHKEVNNCINHYYNKILESDWLKSVYFPLICFRLVIGQCVIGKCVFRQSIIRQLFYASCLRYWTIRVIYARCNRTFVFEWEWVPNFMRRLGKKETQLIILFIKHLTDNYFLFSIIMS